MNVTFYVADKPREVNLASAFKAGVESLGDRCQVISSSAYERPLESTDLAVIVGVTGVSRRCIDEHHLAGKSFLYLDKGFIRLRDRDGGTLHVKISYNDFQPLSYFMKNPMPSDRWILLQEEARAQGYDITPRRRPRPASKIMLSGPSENYAAFHDLHPRGTTGYCQEVVNAIKSFSTSEIVYWPKQSWRDAAPISGTEFGRPPFKVEHFIDQASVFVTHGSNSSVKAILSGVPVIALGPAITSPVAELALNERSLGNPTMPDEEQLYSWLHALTYCQWAPDEIASGQAWKHLREQVLV